MGDQGGLESSISIWPILEPAALLIGHFTKNQLDDVDTSQMSSILVIQYYYELLYSMWQNICLSKRCVISFDYSLYESPKY